MLGLLTLATVPPAHVLKRTADTTHPTQVTSQGEAPDGFDADASTSAAGGAVAPTAPEAGSAAAGLRWAALTDTARGRRHHLGQAAELTGRAASHGNGVGAARSACNDDDA